jgi:Ca-activated chloride channel homolog
MGNQKNYYEILNLPRDATGEEIRRVYRRLVRELHPDSNPDSPDNHEKFILVQEAYETLVDPQSRRKYDGTLPPESPLIKVNTLFSRSSLIKIQEPQLVFALLELSAPENSAELQAPPLNVCILLDHSTSMKGSRMDMVKTTAIEIIRPIRPQDVLSIISFGDHADVILPAGSRANMSQVEHTIQMMQASGGTEIYNGLATGYQEVKRNAGPRYINHILLLTDGRTYGDEEKCVALAQEAAGRGVGISSLGIGTEWNDAFLDKLAAITGGDTSYIERSSDIKELLEEKFRRLSRIFADNLSFVYHKDENVKINYAFRIQPEAAPLESQNGDMKLGSIPTNQSLRVLFEMMVSSVSDEAEEVILAQGRVNMDMPGASVANHSRYITMSRPVTISNQHEQTPADIISALSQVTLYRMQEKAKDDLSDGLIDEAVQRLQNLATHLLAQGESELARTVLIEAQNVSRTRMISAEGSKRIKYGTRGLMLPPSSQG